MLASAALANFIRFAVAAAHARIACPVITWGRNRFAPILPNAGSSARTPKRQAALKLAKAIPQTLDSVDRRLLDIIQSDFPLVEEPYAALGKKVGISAEEAFQRVSVMRRSGLIRRLGANFQSAKLGFVSTLCAARVPKEKLDDFIHLVNAIPGVTHNYERAHTYNIWFTLIAPSREESVAILQDLIKQTGVKILNLPATRLFKIRVDFPME